MTSGAGTTNLVWDGAGRVSAIAFPNGNSNAFAYNGLSQRVGKLDSGGQFGYTLADDSIDANVLADGQASYQYGAGLVSEVRGGVSKAYHADALGTTRAMSGASGTVTDELETDAFGNTVSSVGSTPSPFGFAGQHGYQTDADSGLMRLGYRFYDASVGRFISRDPIQAGYNWYTYCDNDPINAVDPEGLFALGDVVNAGIHITQLILDTTVAVDTRPADYISYNIGFNWPIGLGGNAQLVFTKDGDIYVGAGPSVGTPGPSVSVVDGWLSQKEAPTRQEMDNFLSGGSVNGSGGFIIGGGDTVSKNDGQILNAGEMGYSTPSAGINGTWDFHLF